MDRFFCVMDKPVKHKISDIAYKPNQLMLLGCPNLLKA